mgnify:FL=1
MSWPRDRAKSSRGTRRQVSIDDPDSCIRKGTHQVSPVHGMDLEYGCDRRVEGDQAALTVGVITVALLGNEGSSRGTQKAGDGDNAGEDCGGKHVAI